MLLVLEVQRLATWCFACRRVMIFLKFCLYVPGIFFLEAIYQSSFRLIAQIGLHFTDPSLAALRIIHLPALSLIQLKWKHRLVDLYWPEHHRHLFQSPFRLELFWSWWRRAVKPSNICLIGMDYTCWSVYLLFTAQIVAHFSSVFRGVLYMWAVILTIFVRLLVFSEGIELEAENLLRNRWAWMYLIHHIVISSLHLPRVAQCHSFLSGLFFPVLLPLAEKHATPCWLFHSM